MSVVSLLILPALATPAFGQSPGWPAGVVTVEETAPEPSAYRSVETPTGRLADRTVSFVDLARVSGRTSDTLRMATFEQVVHQLKLAEQPGLAARRVLPDRDARRARANALREQGVVPLMLVDLAYDALTEGTDADDAVVDTPDGARLRTGASTTRRVFAAAPYAVREVGPTVTFVLDGGLLFGDIEDRYEVDFGDGKGYRSVRVGERVAVTYPREGAVVLRVRSGSAVSLSAMEVHAFRVPQPNDELRDRSGRPYAGARGYYDANIYLGDGNNVLDKPILAVEGFDPYGMEPSHPERLDFEDLYLIFSQQQLASRLRAAGYDLVVVRFHDPTTYIQRNAFAVEDMLNWLRPQLAPGHETILVGPSMGGLVTRYALTYMEDQGYDPAVSLLASIDTPHGGANVPLGDQYFFDYFDFFSPKAADGRRAMDSPAARQMLVYHYEQGFLEQAAVPDPLRATFLSELEDYGDYPSSVRNVALANGSGTGILQRRAGNWVDYLDPGSLMVTSDEGNLYRNWRVRINALRDQSRGRVFYGSYRAVIVPGIQSISITYAQPFDGAPGGYRGTNETIGQGLIEKGADYTRVDFANHCFIPTVSALDLATSDLRYHLRNDPANLIFANADGTERTAVFDAIYYPTGFNEPHIAITEGGRNFLLGQIDPSLVPIDPPDPVFSVSLQQTMGEGAGSRHNFQATLVNPPSGTTTFRWYTGPDELGPWTQVQSRTTSATTDTYITFPSSSFGLRVVATRGNQTVETVRWVLVGTGGGGGGGEGECGPFICPREGGGLAVPEVWSLGTPVPNPASTQAALDVAVPEAGHVTVTVHDLLGREVARPVDAPLAAGMHRAELDLSALPAGVYVARMRTAADQFVQRLTVVR